MSRPRVTITLGRTGQVVKRAGPISDDARLEHTTLSGGKRSIRERLGSNVDNPLLYGKQPIGKRQRQDYELDGDRRYISNPRIGREDLRLKLMRKNSSRRTLSDSEEHDNTDLREKLSRSVRSAARTNGRPHMPETRATGYMRRIPPTRSADDLLHMGSLRRPYPVWTLDDLRRRSPGTERSLGAPRGISPPRSMDGSRQIPPVRAVDASRSVSFMPKVAVHSESAKPVVRFTSAPSGVIQKSSYMPSEEHTVTSLLHSLGLGKYSILFQAEEVDMTALKQMGDTDLKELGIPMGPRKKILLALLRSKPRQSGKLDY